ncbi:NAD-dependent epimerase/dehydratase family protein [Bacillaceae bacterium IKA-2]|nr:NAD-dependent epimerase/dehydratase family protein [Bacillaceae bacterium IKA-2]
MARKTALLVGATGLVGGQLLNVLLANDEYEKVISISRRALEMTDTKLQQHIVDFDQLDTYDDFFRVDTVFCALGTTMKQAKTKEQFVKVDFDYPLAVANLAKKNGVKQFFLVTAMGANQHSRIFYNQVKGNIEAAIKELSIPTFYIIRPSLLLGKRHETRFAEDLSQTITNRLPSLFKGPLQKYKPNQAEAVASAMYKLSLSDEQGTFVIDSKLIEANK